ncbi:MAG: carboxypeptidase-like regulatory domain-containing protein [Bacteroidota bacterium]
MPAIQRAFAFVLLLALTVAPALAQAPNAAILTGVVVDDSTGTPLAGVNVFISESTIGTLTDGDGRYRIERVPLGAHRLYVSLLGFEPQPLDIMLREARVYTYDFRLSERPIELDGVEVIAKEDKRWQRNYERFVKLFLGETPNAQGVVIKNPEVIDFQGGLANMKATASDILVIENPALGYRIQYFLKDFEATPTRTSYDGEPLFEEMEPETLEQKQEWEDARREAFIGSVRHFLLAAIANRLQPQGWEIFLRPFDGNGPSGPRFSDRRQPIKLEDVLKPTGNPNEWELAFEGALEIYFKGEREDDAYRQWTQRPDVRVGRDPFQKSWIYQERGPVLIDYKGDLSQPYGITQTGYFAFERMADDVPKEYRPGR